MGSRARHALIVLACAASAQALAAQNPPPGTPPPPPQHDSMARELLLDEMFPVGVSSIAPRVTLNEGIVYRVEIQPGSAQVSIRSVRQPSMPPLFMVPLEGGGPPGANQTAAFLIIPRSTEDYRIDVTDFGTEAVRLRVWTDPREMSRYARMRAATKGLPTAGLSVRAVYLGAFVRPHPSDFVGSAGTASATGVEACLAVVPRGEWFSGPVGGCVLSVAHFVRPDTVGAMWFIATQPGFALNRAGATLEESIVATIGIGTTTSRQRMDYLGLGLALQVATPVLGRHLWLEAEAGLMRMQQLASGPEALGPANIVPHAGLGLQLRF
jgi:hypothetical protein